MSPGDTDFVTTAPAPTLHPAPSIILGRMVALAPIDTPSSTIVGERNFQAPLDGAFLSLVKTTCGAIKTLL